MEDSETGWERFRADIRGSVEVVDTNQQKPKLQFHIPIRPRLPKYRPGSGPSPPRITLRPVHDSDAFIVDKVVLPRGHSHPHSESRQRRCYYIIGWPDLPAARPVVDASKILDYVSPRTLEDWEYQDALQREKELEKEEEAAKLAAAKGKAVATLADGRLLPGAKRRPGRPPKAMMMVSEPPTEPELNSEQEEMIHKRMRGPSLSTPQKSRLAQLVAEEEMLEDLEGIEESSDSAIHRQLEIHDESETIPDSNANTRGLKDVGQSSVVAGRSSGESSRASSARPAPLNPSSSLGRTVAGVAEHHHAAAPTVARQAGDRVSRSPTQVRTRPQISTTPIPLPLHYSQAMKQRISKPYATSRVASIDPQLEGRPVSTQSDQVHNHPSSAVNSPTTHTNGFTPIGGTFPRPPKRPAEESPAPADTPAKTKPKKSRKKQAELTPAEVALPAETAGSPNPDLDLVQGEQDYVVKRLEGDYFLDGVHWFKVRWEGDWPADQNPTWEPRENIAEKLVKQYLKRKANRGANSKKAKTKQRTSLADWAKQYSSVTEAFEGQAELNAPSNTTLPHSGGVDVGVDDDDQDELLVIDENETAAAERRKAMEAQFVAQFASMARAAPQRF